MSHSHAKADLDFARELDFSQILTNPILDIAARFWEDDRYEAFRVCYRSMRRIDDLVDDRKSQGEIMTGDEVARFRQSIETWVASVRAGLSTDEFVLRFLDTLERFTIPFWPWERLCRAMVYDLEHNGFASLLVFLRYTEGAAIAPAAVFMHLCGVQPDGDAYRPPAFDIRRAARPLAVFSYLVHIMRDFEEDQKAGLNYFADHLCAQCGLSLNDLRQIAESHTPTEAFRGLMRRYVDIAEYYRRLARRTVDQVAPYLTPRYQLSLEIIYGLYFQIFERIDPEQGRFTADALLPEEAQIQERIDLIVDAFAPVETI